MQNKRIKTIIILATIFVASLLLLSVYLLYNISKSKKELATQQEEITRLNKELDFYKNQESENKDDKDSDIEIIIPGEE